MDATTVALTMAVGAVGLLGVQMLLSMKEVESSARQSLTVQREFMKEMQSMSCSRSYLESAAREALAVLRESLTVLQSMKTRWRWEGVRRGVGALPPASGHRSGEK